MSRKFIHITTDIKYSVVEIPKENFNDEVQKLLDCSVFETASLLDDVVYILDKSGKLKEKPLNIIATAFYPYFPKDILVGDVLIASTVFKDGEWDLLGLDDDYIDLFMNCCKLVDSVDSLLERKPIVSRGEKT